MKFTIPAAKVRQGDLLLFTSSFPVRDLIQNDFYSIERLDPSDQGVSGYQRLLQTSRARRLADYIVRGLESKDAFLPTSVFLATDKAIEFDSVKNTISFDLNSVGPFSVVDGQHRLEGLRLAAEKDERVLDFEIPVNIASEMPLLHQMCHFLIVNTTQKSVDKSIEQNIYSRLTQYQNTEDTPNLPQWIKKIVDRGDVDKALRITQFLNQEPESAWENKVQMANEPRKKTTTIKQGSFVAAINKYFLVPSNPLLASADLETQKKILLNYWKAIANLLDEEKDTVLFKTNGLALFSRFSIPFFVKIQGTTNKFTINAMQELLQTCFDNIEGQYEGIGFADWWNKGGTASSMNMAAIGNIVSEMSRALNQTSTGKEIEL